MWILYSTNGKLILDFDPSNTHFGKFDTLLSIRPPSHIPNLKKKEAINITWKSIIVPNMGLFERTTLKPYDGFNTMLISSEKEEEEKHEFGTITIR